MDRTGLGVLLCLASFLVPLVLGGILGALIQRKISQYGLTGLIPGYQWVKRMIERTLENKGLK